MTTPAPVSGVSAEAGVSLGDVSVRLSVAPRADGNVPCTVKCNGKTVVVTFKADGDVDFDVPATQAG